MIRFLFILFNLALFVLVCLGFFLIGAQLVVNSNHWYQFIGGMFISSLASLSLFWGGETIASYMFPTVINVVKIDDGK